MQIMHQSNFNSAVAKFEYLYLAGLYECLSICLDCSYLELL